MNYFGHAAVASWREPHAGVALGSMLPDFASMSRTRLAEPTDAPIARGVELHHATDAAFHDLPSVLDLMRELDKILEREGVARGPRHAVAHIGVELLLDGVLVDEQAYRDSYTGALAYDTSGIRFREDEHAERFATLYARLRPYGVPDDLRDPASIVHRLHRVLSPRPLLAPSSADLAGIRTALVEFRPRVELATETVLRALRTELTSAPATT